MSRDQLLECWSRKTVTQAFLGLANFYQRFVKDFTKIAKPLTTLTGKDMEWNWGPDQQTAFETLKTAFTTAPILQIPNNTAPVAA